MKNFNEEVTVKEIIGRINQLKPDSKAQWGKMTVSQMLAHCAIALETTLGDTKLKQLFMGKLFGKMALKTTLGPKPWRRSLPTAPSFVVIDPKIFDQEKERLLAQISRFTKTKSEEIIKTEHPFFGMMTAEQWYQLTYRHLDHHLSQFGV